MIDINEIRFERTVWAERQLAKLCPNNNIQKFQEVLATEDTTKQFDALEDMILILHQAYERKMKFLGKKFEPIELTREVLECFNEEDLANLATRAFADFIIDGEVTVDIEPTKKEKAEAKEAEST